MSTFVLTNADGHNPVHFVASQISAITDLGTPEILDENGDVVEPAYPSVHVLLAGGHDVVVDETLAVVLAAFSAAS